MKQETEFSEFLIPQELQTVEEKIIDQFPDALIKILKAISFQISEIGLAEKEACMIADYPHDTFLKLKDRYPIIVELLALKDLEYKKSLLKPLAKKAKEGDDKMAQWLLTAKYGSEFTQRKGQASDANEDNLIAAGIEFVRKNGDSSDLIGAGSGKAFIVKRAPSIKGKNGKDIIKEVKDLLK